MPTSSPLISVLFDQPPRVFVSGRLRVLNIGSLTPKANDGISLLVGFKLTLCNPALLCTWQYRSLMSTLSTSHIEKPDDKNA